MVMDESLRPAACEVAARLRKSGRTVDLILEPKKMKQVFKVCMVELMHESSAGCSLKNHYMQLCWYSWRGHLGCLPLRQWQYCLGSMVLATCEEINTGAEAHRNVGCKCCPQAIMTQN